MSMKFLTLDNLTKIVEKFKSIFVKLKSDGLAEIDGLYSPSRDQYFTLGDPENLGIDIPEGKTHKILADQEWVTTKISEAELGGKDVDLTPYLTKTEASTTYLKNNVIKLTTDNYGQNTNQNGTPVSTMVISKEDRELLISGEPTYLDYTYKNGGTVEYYKGLIGGMLTTGSTTTFEYPVLCKGSDFDYLLLTFGSDKLASVVKKQFKDSINLNKVDNWYTVSENGELGSFSLPKDFVADEETFEYNATIATRDWVGDQLVGYLKESDAASNDEVADAIDNAINS